MQPFILMAKPAFFGIVAYLWKINKLYESYKYRFRVTKGLCKNHALVV